MVTLSCLSITFVSRPSGLTGPVISSSSFPTLYPNTAFELAERFRPDENSIFDPFERARGALENLG
jgi:hypothetical protein